MSTHLSLCAPSKPASGTRMPSRLAWLPARGGERQARFKRSSRCCLEFGRSRGLGDPKIPSPQLSPKLAHYRAAPSPNLDRPGRRHREAKLAKARRLSRGHPMSRAREARPCGVRGQASLPGGNVTNLYTGSHIGPTGGASDGKFERRRVVTPVREGRRWTPHARS